MPTFNLWGTPASAVKGGTVPATPVKVDAEMVKKVEALLAFAREQTEYLYGRDSRGAGLDGEGDLQSQKRGKGVG
jgi:hypothetical protein